MIPENHPLAKKDGIYFSEINGEPVLPFPLNGHWNNLLEEKLPDSQLLYQTSVETFDKVVHASNLISFESNFLDIPVANHVKVPILDEEAKITYHFGVLKANREQYRNFIRLLEKNKGVTQ